MHLSSLHISNIQKGDEACFKVLYHSVFPVLILYTRKFVYQREDAADLVQETMLVYWKRRAEFNTVTDVKRFLYGTLKNICLNYLRSKKIHNRYIEYTLKEESQNQKKTEWIDSNYKQSLKIAASSNIEITEEEIFVALFKAISLLPPREKEVIELSLKGDKNQEIANNLCISLNTVKTLKQRAYRKLSNTLTKIYY